MKTIASPSDVADLTSKQPDTSQEYEQPHYSRRSSLADEVHLRAERSTSCERPKSAAQYVVFTRLTNVKSTSRVDESLAGWGGAASEEEQPLRTEPLRGPGSIRGW